VNRLGLARIAAMAVVAVMILGFFAFLIFRATTPQMAALYSDLTFDDSSAIVRELQSMNVPYEIRGEGEAILVPRERITGIRMELAQSGLPSRGQVGYEIFDDQNTLGATSFVQNINQVRALEGELARTITSLARIRTARVHLVLPERELFSRERQDPSAAIMVAVRGELSASEIRAIQHLVSSSIEGLSPNSVSIVDDSGRLLASGEGESDFSTTSGRLEERTLAIETRMRTRLEELLANVVGTARARVQVTAELDLETLTTTSEMYDPEGQVVRSAQTRELSNSSGAQPTEGGVSVASQLPGGTSDAGTTNNTESSSTTEETINYEISRVTETKVDEAGGIKRLSVAVVVDGIYTQDAQGNAAYQPRSAAELEQLTALVRSAMGYDAERGDTVQVVNLQFAERPGVNAIGTSEPGLLDFTRDDLMGFVEMAVTIIIALALMLFVLRPLLRRVLEPESEPLALQPVDAPRTALPGQGAAGTSGGQIGDGLPAALADMTDRSGAPAQPPAWMSEARSMGEHHARTLESVGEIVEENPKQATLIVRDWLNQAA
jgi:flagellar M-ring protein FliF